MTRRSTTRPPRSRSWPTCCNRPGADDSAALWSLSARALVDMARTRLRWRPWIARWQRPSRAAPPGAATRDLRTQCLAQLANR